MSVLERWRGVWQRAKEYGVSEEFPLEIAPLVDKYVDEAYCCCVYWFGTPVNKKRHRVALGERSFHYVYFGVPMITISRQATSNEQLCQDIAHEMYHRVTEGRKGLNGKLWIKEMMAVLTSQWFLKNQGFRSYADATKNSVLAGKGKADLQILKNATRGSRRYVLSGAPIYSEEFAAGIWRMGYSLSSIVDGQELCRLVEAKSLQEWVISLPREDQYAACCVLELPIDNALIPSAPRNFNRLFKALEAKGDKEVLTAEFETLAGLQPENGEALFYLGFAYQKARRFDDALHAYANSRDIGYSDQWVIYNTGSVYWSMKDYTLAAEWFQKAADHTPEWAQALHFLGCSLNKLGNLEAARQNWEKARTLPDEHYANLSAKALQEFIVPDAAEEVSEQN